MYVTWKNDDIVIGERLATSSLRSEELICRESIATKDVFVKKLCHRSMMPLPRVIFARGVCKNGEGKNCDARCTCRPNEPRGRFSPRRPRRYKDMNRRAEEAGAESSFVSETRKNDRSGPEYRSSPRAVCTVYLPMYLVRTVRHQCGSVRGVLSSWPIKVLT